MQSTDLRALIEKSLPAARRAMLARVGALAAAQELPLYLVGGFVRDLLLGLSPDDFDFVVEGSAPALARVVARELGGEVTVHAPFGTATWLGANGEAIDFASARTETYLQPAMLPVVQVPAAIAADLSRRDFTLNAMALRVDGEHFGEVLDPHGGRADLEADMVRALHARSFQDDPTRMFRAVRYEQRLGFQIAPDTLDLIPGAWEALAALTGDRVRHEFELIFREPNAVGMLARLQTLEILGHVHPALHWDGRAAERAASLPELPHAEWNFATPLEPDAIYLALLLSEAAPDEVESALTRLNVGRAVGEAVRSALSLKIEGTRPSEVVACLESLNESALAAAYALRPGWRSLIDQYLARWRHVRATLTGDDLIARGLKPGPDFKRILWELRAARLDGLVKSEAEELELLDKVTG